MEGRLCRGFKDWGGLETVMILLSPEFAFLRSQVVAVAFSTSIRSFWVAGAAISTDLIVKLNLLR